MSDTISFGALGNMEDLSPGRELVPMPVGDAIVYVERFGSPAPVVSDAIYPVAPPSPEEAFQRARDVLNECVAALDETVRKLTERLEVSVEFSIGFEVQGGASIVPFLVTAQAKAQTGLRVTATWRQAP